ncbi:unnamed protein product [Prorocentrum cordatum]|uniref:Uncharacterized protein n=1 Tax=Prorocentrum cordatum TaxID=2364126 RepID=A0ABN9XIR3_9DINO|nr:unnamed protein product [Polarella glacialis]
MSSLAGAALPPVSLQLPRPRPAIAWAEASSASPAPRQPSTPRMARGRPVAGRPSGGHGEAAPGPGALGPCRIRRPHGLGPPPGPAVTLHDLLELKRFGLRISESRPGSGTPGRRMAKACTAPEVPRVELVSSGARSGQTSDTESMSDTESTFDIFSRESPRPSGVGAGILQEPREPDQPRRPQARQTSMTSTTVNHLGQRICYSRRPTSTTARSSCAPRARGSRAARRSGPRARRQRRPPTSAPATQGGRFRRGPRAPRAAEALLLGSWEEEDEDERRGGGGAATPDFRQRRQRSPATPESLDPAT